MLLLDAALLPFVFAIFLGVGAIAFGGWYFSPYQTTLRAARSIPRKTIAEVIDGERVRLVGKLSFIEGQVLDAPLSHRPCALFDLQVDVLVKQGKSNRWKELIRESDARDFVLDDGTGRALVRGKHAVTAIVLDHAQKSGTFNDATPELEQLLARYGHQSTDWMGLNKAIRYREGVLEEGEEVAVAGTARWEEDPDARATVSTGYRDAARPKRLVLETTGLPLLASDDPEARKS